MTFTFFWESLRLKKSVLRYTFLYIFLLVITSFFLEIQNKIIARIINQIPILYLLWGVFYGLKRKLFFVEKIYSIILILPLIKHIFIHYFDEKKYMALLNITDMVFSFIAHSLFLIIFRREGGTFFTEFNKKTLRVLPAFLAVIILFMVQLGEKIPDNFFVVYFIFVFLLLLLVVSCENRKISNHLRIIGNLGLYLVIFCTYFALYSRSIHVLPHNYIVYRNSYYIGLFLLLFSSFWNIEEIYFKRKSGV